jgi:SAM-dependent methyltransferase
MTLLSPDIETMSEQRLNPSVMKPGGAYNDACEHQGAGGELAFDLLSSAAAEVPLPPAGTPTVVADLGSSQGRNSLAPMRIAIDGLRARRPANHPIAFVHIDQPANDFTSLFELLDDSPDSYLDVRDVHAYAAGRSFYERVFPDDSITLAWSSFALHWLSTAPVELRDQLWAADAPRDLRACYADQARTDWEHFLDHRARELAPGGRLVVLAPSSPNRQTPWAPAEPVDFALRALQELVDDGVISSDELAAMVFPIYFRTPSEWLAPLHCGPLARTL